MEILDGRRCLNATSEEFFYKVDPESTCSITRMNGIALKSTQKQDLSLPETIQTIMKNSKFRAKFPSSGTDSGGLTSGRRTLARSFKLCWYRYSIDAIFNCVFTYPSNFKFVYINKLCGNTSSAKDEFLCSFELIPNFLNSSITYHMQGVMLSMDTKLVLGDCTTLTIAMKSSI